MQHSCTNLKTYVVVLSTIGFVISPPRAYSSVECIPSHLELGPIECGQVAKSTVYLYNSSKSVLRVGKVSGTCGCMATTIETNDIGPGDKVPIRIDIKTSPGKIGPSTGSVFIHIDSSPRAVITIPISYNVVQSLAAFPKSLALGRLTRDETCQRHILLLPKNKEKYKIRSVESKDRVSIVGIVHMGHDELLLKCSELGLKGKVDCNVPYAYLLTVEVDTSDAGWLDDCKLTVTYEKEDQALGQLAVNFTGIILPEVYLKPEVLRVGRLKPGNSLLKKVKIISTNGQLLSLRKVHTSGDMDISYDKGTTEKASEMTIALSIRLKAGILRKHTYRGTIEVLIDHGTRTDTLKLSIIGYQ